MYPDSVETVDLGNYVEGDLLGLCVRLGRAAVHDGARLVSQLVHGRAAGSGDRLVGVGHDAADGAGLPQRVRHHNQRGGGAVGDGHDAIVPVQVFAVNFRDHQGHRRVHAERAGVVDDQRPRVCRHRPEPARVLGARGDESDVYVGEAVIGGFFHGERFAVDLQLATRRALGCQELQVIVYRITRLDQAQGFLPHRARGSNDRQFHTLKVHVVPAVIED